MVLDGEVPQAVPKCYFIADVFHHVCMMADRALPGLGIKSSHRCRARAHKIRVEKLVRWAAQFLNVAIL